MTDNVFDVLKERGFLQQCTDEAAIRQLVEQEHIACYIGFDPSAASLHTGSLVPIMALAHMQRHGHRPIAIVGGGTGMVGDPSGKTEMRQMLTEDQVQQNAEGLKAQLSHYISFDDGRALLLNNADWLLPLNYIKFLRDIGVHFSVNRMLAAEAYKLRLERGLSFIEFNYQILQAYDFLHLFRSHNCKLQMGGDDQWGNILAGIDLIRRVEGSLVHGMTFPLLTTATGKKMGKTEEGTIWLNPQRLSSHDFFQFWRNTDDRDVEKFLGLFTFLPMDEVRRLGALTGADINIAKETLAFETTKLAHGEAAATVTRDAARALFGSTAARDAETIPTVSLPKSQLENGIKVVELLLQMGLVPSRNEARRLIIQGGAYINDERIDDLDDEVSLGDLVENRILVRAGKKRYARLVIGE